MAGRRLKVFRAHLGFYDTIVAAPSQQAALAAWGAGRREFANGFAQVTSDPAAVASALSRPGQVLKRPFGSKGEYKLQAAPVSAPKPTPAQHKASLAAARQRKGADAAQRRAAQLELRKAKQEEARALAELKRRAAELEREKIAAREDAKKRIARARARLSAAR